MCPTREIAIYQGETLLRFQGHGEHTGTPGQICLSSRGNHFRETLGNRDLRQRETPPSPLGLVVPSLLPSQPGQPGLEADRLDFLVLLVLCAFMVFLLIVVLAIWFPRLPNSTDSNKRLMKELDRHTGEDDATGAHTS